MQPVPFSKSITFSLEAHRGCLEVRKNLQMLSTLFSVQQTVPPSDATGINFFACLNISSYHLPVSLPSPNGTQPSILPLRPSGPCLGPSLHLLYFVLQWSQKGPQLPSKLLSDEREPGRPQQACTAGARHKPTGSGINPRIPAAERQQGRVRSSR